VILRSRLPLRRHPTESERLIELLQKESVCWVMGESVIA
jgi:hypothetical protein